MRPAVLVRARCGQGPRTPPATARSSDPFQVPGDVAEFVARDIWQVTGQRRGSQSRRTYASASSPVLLAVLLVFQYHSLRSVYPLLLRLPGVRINYYLIGKGKHRP